MESFDPYNQNITLLFKDGQQDFTTSISEINEFIDYSMTNAISYAIQLGSSLIMLLILLLMTPSKKLPRPSTILQASILSICIVRMGLLTAWFPSSDFNKFYNYFSMDYSDIPLTNYHLSVLTNTTSVFLVIAVEAALMHQAWTMVALWPSTPRIVLTLLSVSVTVLTVGWRVAGVVLQNRAILEAVAADDVRWVMQTAIVANTVSIFWFCALFNVKLVGHLVQNRSLLPCRRNLNPMEVLVMTNGILMFIPAIFSVLQFIDSVNIETGSLTLTSVALILPLGTLAAQRASHSYDIVSISSSNSSPNPIINFNNHHHHRHPRQPTSKLSTTRNTYSSFSFPTSGSTCVDYSSTASSYRETSSSTITTIAAAAARNSVVRDPNDVELGRIDDYDYDDEDLTLDNENQNYMRQGRVHVHLDFEQREERI